MPNRSSFQALPVLIAAGLLASACTLRVGRGHGPGTYADWNSATAACRQQPALCTKVAGEEVVVPASRVVRAAAAGTAATLLTVRVLDGALRAQLEQALKECADQARSEILIRRLDGRSPTVSECLEEVGVDRQGEPVTRAMRFGEEMHRVALQCAKEKLDKLRPGGFSLDPRYRYDPRTKQLTLVSPAEEQLLLQQGRGSELRGTLVPDVVLHDGNPLKAQEVYDFKFPCVNTDTAPPWRRYPQGHPYEGSSQGDMYQEALQVEPARVVPRLGVIR